jgi:sterol desaturase/sphingolipid hydroxylase (fatty acid hydroxylase superfamily)
MTDIIETTAELFEALFIPILLIEFVWLHRRGHLRWGRIKEMLGNLGAFLLFIPAAILGVVIWLPVFDGISGAIPWSIPTNIGTVVLAIVLADLIYYLEHRFEHEHRLPWDAWHSVHHSSPEFDQTTSLRLGIFDGLITTVFSLPLILAGFSPTLVLAATALVIGYQTWIHTETIKKMPRWFEAVFNTPSHHRAHHGADAHYLDVNYGGILILWDRLFGTFRAETNRPDYGLTTQIESTNPLDIQFSQLKLLTRDLRRDHHWGTRMRRLWNRPGWEPVEPTPAAASA